MIMLRSFLPVGQGAFYREVFNKENKKYTIVYDCGSSTDKRIVEQQIHHEFGEGETIAAVFISHLDEDHINGLPYLLKYCNVENLFFPLITTKDKVYLKLHALLSHNRDVFLYKFIEDPYDAFKFIGINSAPRLFQIMAAGEQNNFNNTDATPIPSGENILHRLHLEGLQKSTWELIPYNFRAENRINDLRHATARMLGCQIDEAEEKLERLIENFPNNKDKIKEIYRGVTDSFNTNSLTLFSGMRNHHFMQYYALTKKHPCWSCPGCKPENGCLYLGDYDASGSQKWADLKRAYNDYWDYIGCIQIPHHGSKYSYNEEISKMCALSIISAGRTNSYRHPHSAVIKDLVLNDCKVHIVTEDVGSQLDLRLWYN